MSDNLGTRRPTWVAKLFYVIAAALLILFVGFAIRAVSDEETPARGASGTLTPDDAVTPPPPITDRRR
jgi:hypothetical protein